MSHKMEIPEAGFGTYELEPKDCRNAILEAVKIGYRHFDFASFYNNQKDIGPILSDVLLTHSRDEFFFTSKIWPTEMSDVEGGLRKTLKDLELEHLDLYLLHWPLAFDEQERQIPLELVWREMERVERLGLTRKIGISNFNTQMMLDVYSYAEIIPYCNEIEVNVHENKEKMIAYSEELGIRIASYRPIGSCKQLLYENQNIISDIKRRGCTIPQLALKYISEKNNVSVIAKSSQPARIAENFAFSRLDPLTTEEVEHFDALRGSEQKSADGVAVWKFNVFE